ncbi:MAG: nickel pincer cofactor biosynthesis protein LarC [Thermoplasmata archaeon]
MSDDTTLYLHCFSGISGDMLIGALLDTGMVDLSYLQGELNKVAITGYSMDVKKVTRSDISGTKFTVKDEDVDQPLRTLTDLLALVEESDLSRYIKKRATEIFTDLAKAEAEVHHIPLDEVHFHEIGAVDTVVDVVGALILMEKMKIKRILSSNVHTGTGFVKCAHGTLPVPAPATMELLKGVPVYSTGVEGELVTPTGAAILSTLTSSYSGMPQGIITSVGYGAGYKEIEHPNLLRAVLLKEHDNHGKQEITILETNIDDMNPEIYSYLFDSLFEAGALDLTLTPIYMKKNRPAAKLTVLCNPALAEPLMEIIFRETSTFGVRIINGHRVCLDRKIVEVKTPYGEVKVKVGSKNGEPVTISPEYEHCAEIARAKGVALKEVYREALCSAEDLHGV